MILIIAYIIRTFFHCYSTYKKNYFKYRIIIISFFFIIIDLELKGKREERRDVRNIHSILRAKLPLRSGVRAIITWALRVSLGETLRAGHIRSYFDSEHSAGALKPRDVESPPFSW